MLGRKRTFCVASMACVLCGLPPAAFWVGGLGGIPAAEEAGLEKGQFRTAR